ncbi:MAG: hypothetical protein H0X64_12650 [Gemmatimonadaceae bacterium]|nr:hypothetical protein [Gemmatimonadaceae bacterium]
MLLRPPALASLFAATAASELCEEEVMFRSKLVSVLSFSAIVALGACAGGDDTDLGDTATVTVPPAAAPMPMDTGMRMDTGWTTDTMRTDTTITP